MKSIFKIAAMVTVVGVLCVAVVALADDFIWDGEGVGGAGPEQAWVNEFMWDQGSGYPDDANDNATIADPDPTAICEYAPTSALTVKNLTLAGASPTKMTLHIKDADLTVNSSGLLVLNDYADLDIDENLTAAVTHVSGTVWVDVAADKVFDTTLDLWAKSPNAVLNLTTGGTMRVLDTWVDSITDGKPRGLKIVGGTYTVKSPLGLIGVMSDVNGDNAAKFWWASGTIDFECAGNVRFNGGTTFARRVQVDIDQDFDVSGGEVTTGFTGQVHVDIASGKTFNTSDLVLYNTARVKVTGGGTLVSSTQVACQ